MSLRMRLFVWVGSLFLIGFVSSVYVENYLTKKNLIRAEENLTEKVVAFNKVKLLHVEEFLAGRLGKEQAQINTVLGRVSEYEPVRNGFAPTINNAQNATWLNAASLMVTNQWLDFIQNINEGELASEITLNPPGLNQTLKFPIDENSAIFGVNEDGKWNGPYLGIRLDVQLFSGENEVIPPKKPNSFEFYVLFKPETIRDFKVDEVKLKGLNLSINLLEPFLFWIEIPARREYIESFLNEIQEIGKKIKANPKYIPDKKTFATMIASKKGVLEQEEEKDKLEQRFPHIASKSHPIYKETLEQHVNVNLISLDNRYDQIGMVWGLSALYNWGQFGNEPFSKNSPIGISRFDTGKTIGRGVLSKDVFFLKPFFQIKDCNVDPQGFCFNNHIEVILSQSKENAYFGNTLRLTTPGKDGKTREGFLTIGLHSSHLLRDLALSTHQIAAFVSKDEIINVFDQDGIKLNDIQWRQLPVSKLLKEEVGVITVEKVQYYYLHMQPFKHLDLHFFIFNPKVDEFSLITSLKESAQHLISRITLNLRLLAVGALIIVLFILSRIAKKITAPIARLAEETKRVGEGRLEEVSLPELSKAPKDEIYILYQNFSSMVKGLQEKEKVRGILNKVVSAEIAEETLKGNIHLGGEEKIVTVLFADIRHFTQITENMAPHDVIALINTCMTKLSNIIDEHGGVIDKYVGDEVMALFGAPVVKEDNALKAVQSAICMLKVIAEWNTERAKEGQPAIEIGIGIHTGNVVAGNMGADNRLNYTVLGSGVNLASRLCSAAKGMEIFISEGTLSAPNVKENIQVESMTPIKLKGFTNDVPVFQVKG